MVDEMKDLDLQILLEKGGNDRSMYARIGILEGLVYSGCCFFAVSKDCTCFCMS